MASGTREILAGIATVSDMVVAFGDEDRCRPATEAMIWPRAGFARDAAIDIRLRLPGVTSGRRARPGLTSVRTASADCSSR